MGISNLVVYSALSASVESSVASGRYRDDQWGAGLINVLVCSKAENDKRWMKFSSNRISAAKMMQMVG